MKLSMYKETDLEQWIYTVYQQNGINQRSDLTLKKVAEAFNCEVVFWNGDTKAVWDDDFGTIFLNEELKGDDQREAFFHELGHIFLHVGNQLDMPQTFNDLQEQQASHFMIYASMPMYMIKQYPLTRTEKEFADLLSWEFDLSIKLAKARIDQIKRRIFQSQSDEQFVSHLKSQRRTYDPLDPSGWSDETKRIMDQLSSQLAAKRVTV